MQEQSTIVQWLFETGAIQVAQPDQPFWYTSGTLGPYYINTHYLYGDQASAEGLLKNIEEFVADPLSLPSSLRKIIMHQYENNRIFHAVMSGLIEALNRFSFDLISGGERRDFFFSIPAASLLGVAHLSILKDGRSLLSSPGFEETIWTDSDQLKGMRVMHVADLVTEASSYLRTWIPVVQKLGGSMDDTIAIIDRKQGGAQALKEAGTKLESMASIEDALFVRAVRAGLMSSEQQEQIRLFMNDPHHFMTIFLQQHPNYLSEQIAAGGKAAQRAQLCLEKGYGTI